MIPLRDASRTPVRFPVVTVSLIAVSVLAFAWEVGSDDAAIIRWAVVPAELMRGRGWITPFTAMFLHGGAMHMISNMVFLAAFAPMVEDAMGRGRFLVFYLLGGLAATAAQIGMAPASAIPQLGASGAIAAVMGAFLVTYPGDRIKVLWFFGLFAHVSQVPALLLIGLWLVTQVLKTRLPRWGPRRWPLCSPSNTPGHSRYSPSPTLFALIQERELRRAVAWAKAGRALPAGRLARLGATPDFHHGLLRLHRHAEKGSGRQTGNFQTAREISPRSTGGKRPAYRFRIAGNRRCQSLAASGVHGSQPSGRCDCTDGHHH